MCIWRQERLDAEHDEIQRHWLDISAAFDSSTELITYMLGRPSRAANANDFGISCSLTGWARL